MIENEDFFKRMNEDLEKIKIYLPQSQQQNQHKMMREQQQYGHHNNMQGIENQNYQYMDDSPEPENFNFPNYNIEQEPQQQFHQNRGNFKQQQGFNSTQKPFFKKQYENQIGGKPFNNGNTQSFNPSQSGYQGKRPFINKYNQSNTPSTASQYSGNTTPGGKFQGSKPYSSQGSQFGQGNGYYQGKQQQNDHNGEYQNYRQQENHSQNIAPQSQGNHIAGTKIFVNNIESDVNDEEILHYFIPFGKINDLKVFHKNDQHYAYVIFDKYEDAYRASNEATPKSNWTVSLAKSKNTVMQYQQSSLYNPSQDPPYTGSSKFQNTNNIGVPPFKKPFNKFQSDAQNQPGPSRYDKVAKFQNRDQDGGEGIEADHQGFSVGSHMKKTFNNDNRKMMDFGIMQQDGTENPSFNKTQINQTILVREIWISNIDEKCKQIIREVIEDNFGPIEEVEFFDRGSQSFAFVKFYMVQTAYHAFANKEKIAELLETEQVKLTYSDPSRRGNIIGDHENYMKDENLSPVLYISFPFGFKVNKFVIQKIASDYGTVQNVTVKRSEDPKQTSSVLIEFKDLKDTKFAFKHMREDQEKMNPKCEFAILLNSDKFVKENNLKLKEKQKPGQPIPNTNNYNNTQISGIKKTFPQKGVVNNSLQDISGAPNSKPLQQQGRQFSPEKEQDINSKRTYKQHKQEQQERNTDFGYNPDQEHFQEEDDEDDENFIWSGFISINKKGRCGMDAKVIQQQSGQLDFDYNLIMTTKCDIQEPLRYPPFAVLIFRPSNETSIKPFKDVKSFLNTTPNQAGLINSKYLKIYLLPNCEEVKQMYPNIKESNILAICHNSESLKGVRSKKEVKYEEKIQQRNRVIREQDEGQEGEVQKLVYDPTSILQDTTRIKKKKIIQVEEDSQEEDIYDPNEIQMSKNDSKNTDLSDLIDNPALVDNMLKSLN